VALLMGLALGFTAAMAQPQAPPTEPAAKVGDETITLEDVTAGVRTELAKLEEQRWAILEERLDRLIDERLLAREAARRGVPPEVLLEREAYAGVPEPSDAEVGAFIAQNRGRLPQLDEAELRVRVRDHLRSQRMRQRHEAFLQRLHEQTAVAVYLAPPDGLRRPVATDRGFAKGPQDAPVIIVEFSDFQCPFCKTVNPTLGQLLEKYAGKVRLVFRDYPLAQLHPGAPMAHEAARCAGEQGRFWDYHDMLFDRSPRHSPGELKQYAQELKLDTAAFGRCLDSGKYEAEIARDVQEGGALGVTATPSFFINGRYLEGARPLAAFQRIIERELARKPAR
jgi:protein-disulfide isomerase